MRATNFVHAFNYDVGMCNGSFNYL